MTAEPDPILDAQLPPPVRGSPPGNGQVQARTQVRQTREAQAVAYRLAGLSFEQVAQRVGYTSKATAARAVQRVLDRTTVRLVEELRDLENARYDTMQVTVWAAFIDTSLPLDRRLMCLDRLLRISEARRRLNGMDAPVKIAITDETTAEVERILEEMEAMLTPADNATITTLTPEPDDGAG